MFSVPYKLLLCATLVTYCVSPISTAQDTETDEQVKLKARISTLHSGYARAALTLTKDEDKNHFFNDVVHPILETRCFRCHGEEKQKGDLRLNSLASILSGGEKGAAIIPSDAEKSLLIEAIRHTNDDFKMPKEKLPQGEIDVLTSWVAIGAPWPAPPEPEIASSTPAPTPRKRGPVITMALEKGTPISFTRDIRPILSDNCFACHGPDEKTREANLRLDLEAEAFKALAPGFHALVPGDIEKSLLFQRIATQDADDIMPPADFPKQLSKEQIELFGRWILQGAPWETHWAFAPPERAPIPQVEESKGWVKNPIDLYVLNTLENKGFTPNKPADKRTLVRRLSLDLTGLPPIPADVDAFVNDTSPDAYGKLVDRLLDSPQYGEHMARIWLDAARYADTNGYHIDNERNMWRWRDWVIDAYNENKPFDVFTIEQLAGDLLENPTPDQLIATGFNRNHMVNFEGGAIPEEYRIQYVSDRLETTGTVWLGLTMNCAKCHDHKYDPLSQKEYYQMFAFFNTIDEKGLDGNTPSGNAMPLMDAPQTAHTEKRDALETQVNEAKASLHEPVPELDTAFAQWKKDSIAIVAKRWTPLTPTRADANAGSTLSIQDDATILAQGDVPKQEDYTIELETSASTIVALKLDTLTVEGLNHKIGRSENGNFVLSEFEVEYADAKAPDTYKKVTFIRSFADIQQDEHPIGSSVDGKAETGWAPNGQGPAGSRSAVFIASTPFGYPEGTTLRIKLSQQSKFDQHLIGQFRISITEAPEWATVNPKDWYTSGPYIAKTNKQALGKKFVNPESVDLTATYDDQRSKWNRLLPNLPDGQDRNIDGALSATYFYRIVESPVARHVEVKIGASDAIQLWVNGVSVHKYDNTEVLKKNNAKVGIDLKQGSNTVLIKTVNYTGQARFSFSISNDPIAGGKIPQQLIFGKPESEWQESEKESLIAHYRSVHWDQWKDRSAVLAKVEKEFTEHVDATPKTMIMGEMADARKTFMLNRGDYDSPMDEVFADTPAFLSPLPEDYPKNRLGLAKWLVDANNPLTARVTVNRIWARFFGLGLVTTSEDFGSQGALPSHPELLNWLAQDFVDSGWDLKAIQRTILNSATYKQSSKVTPEIYVQDTTNTYLARGSRFRVDAEMVRDGALAIAGLLVNDIGGKSVLPYQPAGLWQEVGYGGNFTAQVFKQDSDDKLYRRSMYTFWKRTSPPPSMMIFDAPNRETCSVSRSRSNTPLQALTLMNDPQFVEAARALGERMIIEGGDTVPERIDFAFQLATARPPSEREKDILSANYHAQYKAYQSEDTSYLQLLEIGDSKYNAELDKRELAAWSIVASMILNLDETITRN